MAGVDFYSQTSFEMPSNFSFPGFGSGESGMPSIAKQEKAMHEIQGASDAMSYDPQLALNMLKDAQSLLGGGSTSGANGGLVAQSAQAAQSSSNSQTGGYTPSLSANGNSVNTGMYTIAGSTNDDGSLTITNNQTGQQTEVWGDPHVKVNGKDTAEFQKGLLNIQLQDGTTVHIDPTQLNNGVAHIGQVSITNGNQTVTMGGSGQNGFEGGVNTSQVMNGVSNYSSGLYNSPNATDITMGADGNLYQNNANGSMGNEITAQANGGETNLDDLGGGQSANANNDQMLQTVQQLLQTLMASGSQSFQSYMMQSTLQQMDQTLQNGNG